MLAGARCQVRLQRGSEIERRPATNTRIHTYSLWEEGGAQAHRERRQHEKNIKSSLEMNCGPFHNIIFNMNRIKYIFIQQEIFIYLVGEFWQPWFVFLLIISSLTFVIIGEAVPVSLAARKDRSPALHCRRIFYYIKQQALSPPLNYCQHWYLLQHQIGLVTKWRIWIIHSI